MPLRCVVAMLAAVSIAPADTLALRNGKTVQGSYLGGDSRQIRMATGETVQTFDVGEVSSIQSETAAPAVQPPKAEDAKVIGGVAALVAIISAAANAPAPAAPASALQQKLRVP